MLARLVEAMAWRPQVQKRMTSDIADWLSEQLPPRVADLVLDAEHFCMSIRGIRATEARTVTSALLGGVRDDPASHQEFLSLADASLR